MFGNILSKKAVLFLIARILGATLAVLSGCSDGPTPPRPNRWELAAELPITALRINGLATFGIRRVYICGQDVGNLNVNNPAIIYKYEESKIEEIFRAAIPYSEFYAIGSGGGLLWAAGSKLAGPDEHRPYVVRYDNRDWVEVPVPPSIDAKGFLELYPSEGLFCWFLGDNGIYTYDAGVWEKHLPLPEYGTKALAVTKRGKAFVYIFDWRNNGAWVYISGDRGRTWVPERVVLPYSNFKLTEDGIEIISPADDTIYFYGLATCGKERSNFKYRIIITRDDAAAGEGVYTIAFAAPRGPYFYGIRDMAFKSSSDGYAVGGLTSVALERGEWILEDIPESWSASFKAVVAGPSSYWALVEGSEYYSKPALYETR